MSFDATRTSTSGISFVVESSIEPNLKYLSEGRRHQEPTQSPTLENAWRSLLPTKEGLVEAMSPAPPNTVEVFTRQNLFAKAVHAAFYGHHPLVLSPDIIWLTIMQGLANHVDQEAETLRAAFVTHGGKKEIEILRPEFIKGSPDNDWPGVFPEFASKISELTVGGIAELAAADFSTSGPVEKIVAQITLMDTVQHYFSYSMCCGCGFPSIHLSGTPADWERVRAKAEALRPYHLDWWLGALLPALDEFVRAAHGAPNLDFWRSLCNINTGTSFPVYEPLTGWVQVFFPYLIKPGRRGGFDEASGGFDVAKDGVAKRKLMRNEYLDHYATGAASGVNVTNFKASLSDELHGPPPRGTEAGVKLELFPPGLASAPFKYKDQHTGKTHQMAFYGGVTCLVQHTNGAIEPKVGWAVLDSGLSEVTSTPNPFLPPLPRPAAVLGGSCFPRPNPPPLPFGSVLAKPFSDVPSDVLSHHLPRTYEGFMYVHELGMHLLNQPTATHAQLSEAFALFRLASEIHTQYAGVPSPSALYNLACCCSRSATLTGQSQTSPTGPGILCRTAEECVDMACVWLRVAIASGYHDHAHLKADGDLHAVRAARAGKFATAVQMAEALATGV